MFKRLLQFIAPFSEIAKELRILRELKEAELAAHNPPIYRVTEDPKKDDTEVTYMDDEKKSRSALRKLMEGDITVDEEEKDDDELFG